MSRLNYIILAIGALVMLLGYFLMAGTGSTESAFNPDIFSPVRIRIAPIVCVVGFVIMGAGIMIKRTK